MSKNPLSPPFLKGEEKGLHPLIKGSKRGFIVLLLTQLRYYFYGTKRDGFASHHEKMFTDIFEIPGVLNL